MPQSPHSSNLLLASLPPENIAALMPHLRVVELPQETVLFEAGDTIKALYFPHNGIVSILVDLTSGEMIETAMVGRDSLVGGSAAVDDDIALNRAVVQVPGIASTVEVVTFRGLVQQSQNLHAIMARHRQFILAQAQQSAACRQGCRDCGKRCGFRPSACRFPPRQATQPLRTPTRRACPRRHRDRIARLRTL